MRTTLAILALFASLNTFAADDIGNILASNEVNHFQLLVNNLNMLFLAKADDIYKTNEGKDTKPKLLRFVATRTNIIHLNVHIETTVPQVTQKYCTENLADLKKQMMEGELSIPALITFTSVLELTPTQVDELVNSMTYSATLIADVNNELTITCYL